MKFGCLKLSSAHNHYSKDKLRTIPDNQTLGLSNQPKDLPCSSWINTHANQSLLFINGCSTQDIKQAMLGYLGKQGFNKTKLVQDLASGKWYAAKPSRALESVALEKLARLRCAMPMTVIMDLLQGVNLEIFFNQLSTKNLHRVELSILFAKIVANTIIALTKVYQVGILQNDTHPFNLFIDPATHEITLSDFDKCRVITSEKDRFDFHSTIFFFFQNFWCLYSNCYHKLPAGKGNVTNVLHQHLKDIHSVDIFSITDRDQISAINFEKIITDLQAQVRKWRSDFDLDLHKEAGTDESKVQPHFR
jgi:hypothetical protein